jgi:serine/threonine protein kinase
MAPACIVPPMHVAAGTGRVVAGRYYLQDPIGRGAMGTVWRARDALLARDVAVKEVLLRGASTPEDMRVGYERTLREARTAAQLNHPAVVTIFDVVEADGRPWIVMELVPARSLEDILAQDGPLPPLQAADVGKRLLGALATAHAAGILHRDVKPSNVLLGADDRAVLTDFGIATLAGDPGLTQVGMVMGTPGFTAPERIRGEPATPASDLWSLGATLYAAVEGHGPFDQRGSSFAVLSSIANEDAPRPRSAAGLGPAIEALLRRDPSARPDASSARRLLAAAVTPPAHNRPAGGKYREDREDREDREGPFQGNAYRSEGSRADGHKGDANPRGGYRRNGGPTARPAGGSAGTAALPVSSTFLPEGSPPGSRPTGSRPTGSRPTAPQPPVAELPSWMSFPPEESPPEGMRPSAAKGGSAPNDLPPGAVAPSPANLVRAAGLPAGSDTPAGTGLSGAGITFPRPAGHPAGRHGAQAAGRQRWLLAGLGAVVVVCAGVAGGLAIGHSGRSSLPSGYHWYTALAARTGTTAGFTMAVPNGWRANTRSLISDVVDPVGHVSMQVDLTPYEAATAPGEASMLEKQARTDGSLPGYRRVALRPLLFHGRPGAAWEYTWQEPGIGRVDVLDVLFTERGRAGRQAYQIQVSTPMAGRTASRAIFDEALRTFGPR